MLAIASMDDEEEQSGWLGLVGIGVLIMLLLIFVVGGLLWWAFTGTVPGFGLAGLPGV